MKGKHLFPYLLLLFLFLGGCNTSSDKKNGKDTLAKFSIPPSRIVTEDDRKLADKFILEGKKMTSERQYTQALAHFRKALELNPDDLRILKDLANIYKKMNDLESASRVYDVIIKKDPVNKEAWEEKAQILEILGRFYEAAQAYQGITGMNPKNMDAYLHEASCYARGREFEKAEEAYTSAIKEFPGKVEPIEKFATYWMERADMSEKEALIYYQKASDYYEKASKVAGNSGEKYRLKFNCGKTLYRKWRISKNEKDRKKAIRVFTEYLTTKRDLPWKTSASEFIRRMKPEETEKSKKKKKKKKKEKEDDLFIKEPPE